MNDLFGEGVMRVVRLFSDPAGASHFEDVELRASTRSVDGGARNSFVDPLAVERLELRDTLEEDEAGTPHNAPRRQFVLVLRGAYEVEASDGESRSFTPGDVLFVEDVTGRGHRFFGRGPDRRMAILPVADDFELPVT